MNAEKGINFEACFTTHHSPFTTMANLSRRTMLKLTGNSAFSLLAMPLLEKIMSSKNATMLQRIIPSSGEKLPVVGLGSWLQFDVGNSATERQPLTEVLQVMLSKGGKVIDASPMYGKAEAVIGDLTAASGNPDKYFYATKVWTRGEQSGIKQMQESMQKMRRKTIDLMQVHNLSDWQTQLKTMNRWKSEGKIRYTGVTHYTVSMHKQLEEIARQKLVDFLQFNFSIRVRNAETSLLKAARDSGVAVIINEPFESGNLFSMVKGKPLPEWAKEYDINSWAQYFLKYILSNPAVNCVIPGTSNPKHAADNMMAGYGILPDEKGKKKMVDYITSL
jgi:diketogulonate reductase-like aldo/keto reductase